MNWGFVSTRIINERLLAIPLVFLIRLYRILLSPLFPPSCRFEPTCSEYCIRAIQKKGLLKGLWHTLVRLLKCHPFHPGGYDPI